jgi:hypothetical protein
MSKFSLLTIVVIALALVLAACGPEPTPTPQPEPPEAVLAAEQQLSKELGIPVQEIDYVSFSREQWRDSCLGLAAPGEMCLQVITPGWRVVLKAEGQQYVYRTDESGEAIRREE